MKRKIWLTMIPALALACPGAVWAQQPPTAQSTYQDQSSAPAQSGTSYYESSTQPATARTARDRGNRMNRENRTNRDHRMNRENRMNREDRTNRDNRMNPENRNQENRMNGHPASASTSHESGTRAGAAGQSRMNPRNGDRDAMGRSAQGRYVSVDGMKLYCRMQGQGQPIILLHGYPLNGNLFRHQRSTLSRHYKVITPDLPGFGRSRAKNDHASIKSYAQTMFDLMDKLDIHKAVIGGHSMGGMTVIQMYKMHPDRFKGMILIDTAGIKAPLPRKMLWQGYAKLGRKSQSQRDKVMTMLLPAEMLSGHTRQHDQQVVDQAKQMMKSASRQGVIGGADAIADRPDNSSVLDDVDVPTLIIVGANDPITPIAIAKKMHQAIDGSKLAIIDGASHLAVLEKPHEVNRHLMQWLHQFRNQDNNRPANSSSSRNAGMHMRHNEPARSTSTSY